MLLAPLDAAACSCVGQTDPWRSYAEAEAAVIGVYEGKQGPTTYMFRVVRSFKRSFGPTLAVRSAADGAACGFEVQVGAEVGLYLAERDGAWHSTLCAQVPAAELRRAAAGLPRPNGKGRLRFVVGGSFGTARLQGLDAQGRTLAYGFGTGTTSAIDVCPAGRRLVEVVGTENNARSFLAVRDLAALRVRRQLRLPVDAHNYISAVHCVGRGGEAFVFSGTETGGRVLHVRGSLARVVHRTTGYAVAFSGRMAYIAELGRVIRLELRSGRVRSVASVSRRIDRMAASPDGRALALVGSGRITVVDTARGKVTASLALGPNVYGEAVWIDNRTFAFLPSGGDGRGGVVYDRRGRRVGGFSDWNTTSAVVAGGKVVGVGWGLLQSARLPRGPTRRVRDLFSRATFAIAAVSGGPKIRLATLRCVRG